MLNYCNCGGEVRLEHNRERWYTVCNDCGSTSLLTANNRLDAVREWNGCISVNIKHAVENALSDYADGYALLQLPVENYKTFRGFDDIHGIVELNNYKIVYASKSKYDPDTYSMLDMLFEMFNIAHPSDYMARSMSVSDIVAVKHNDSVSYYFCDRVGFRLLKE